MSDLNEHPAAKRMRLEFEAKYGEASNLMRAANHWFGIRTQYNDAWNRDRERPITLEDVEAAEREMLAPRAQPAQAGQVSEPLGIGQIAGLVDAAQEPMLKDVVSLCETIRYMVGIAERGSGRKCPDDMQPEMFLLDYVKQLEAMQPQGNAVQVLEFVAQHKSSDWPERCQRMVDMARAALSAAPAQAGQVLTDAEVDAAIPHPTTFGQFEPAWNGSDMKILRGTARAIESAVLARVARVPQWIEVAERMPEPGTECLVRVKALSAKQAGPTHYTHIDTWDEQHEAPLSWSSATIPIGLGWGSFEFDDVTHWMPLPPPPGIVGEKGGRHG